MKSAAYHLVDESDLCEHRPIRVHDLVYHLEQHFERVFPHKTAATNVSTSHTTLSVAEPRRDWDLVAGEFRPATDTAV